MIPSALVAQLEKGMKDFLRASFWSTTSGFEEMLEAFVEGVDGEPSPLFRGPFLTLHIPFEAGTVGKDYFEAVPMKFDPHRHQEEAFRRLSGPKKENTLVATGTGSGKTECFLHPILAHCESLKLKKGIKAILIYPMNALAQDQAERLAMEIHSNPRLKGIRAGLYVGDQEESPRGIMSEEGIITDKEILRQDPPDILLTNYKMLDYLLIRPRDQVIWKKNGPETLQFLVVDELHTFDGAQGTDLGSLLRRIKARLKTPPAYLTCVGTSATMGSGGDAEEKLLKFAEQVFGESFPEDSIIREQRIPKDRFLPRYNEEEKEEIIEVVPGPDFMEALDPLRYEDTSTYVAKQSELWFGSAALDQITLGERLKEHFLLERLLFFTRKGPISLEELRQRLSQEGSFRNVDQDLLTLQLFSFLSLISHARDPDGKRAFLQLRLELWQREMRRMVATVEEKPLLHFHDDLTREERKRHLPVVYCRECGLMGWATVLETDKPNQASVGLQTLYRAFFANDSRVKYFFPRDSGIQSNPSRKVEEAYICPQTLRKSRELEEGDAEQRPLVVLFPENTKTSPNGLVSHKDCPACEAKESLSLLGFRAASLTSTYINQLFASPYNDDKRLLAFSDSVQDAAHRAGFFEARTWRFNLRIGIQKALVAAGGDLPLSSLPEVVETYWRERLSDEAYVSNFLAPDLAWFRAYREMRTKEKLPKKHDLFEQIRGRLSWEIFSEYSFQSRIGRSLPRTGASLAYVSPEKVEAILPVLREELANQIGGLRNLKEETLRAFLTGFFRRILDQGAVFQPELDESYIKTGGENTFVMSQLINHLPGFGPGSRLPVFVASRPTTRFPALTQRSGESWYERWFYRVFGQDSPLIAEMAGDALRSVIVPALVKAKILEERIYGGTHIWGLRPEALGVTTAISAIEEEVSHLASYVPTHELNAWYSMPAMGIRGGVYGPSKGPRKDYYARVYQSGEVARIIADEHTGLLERQEREEVERQFKAKAPKPWYPNLLSCTSTLEMGIDVGSLSTAVLCSVPPSQANYLQRIGRAGRRDGNSLLLTFVTARAHDLYFFAEPEEMVSGEVLAPGVFLNASAVLERQLTAYCFDLWAASGVEERDLPRKLGTVIDRFQRDRDLNFPGPLLHFIEEREDKILDEFLSLFEDQLTEDSREYLRHFLRGDDDELPHLRYRIVEAFESAARDLKKQSEELKRIQQRLKKLEKEEVLGEDEKQDMEKMEQEIDAQASLIKRLKSRDTLEFLTNEGLLPNYAFPEAGVTLKSVIWRKREPQEGGKGKYDTVTYEYERPSRAAIRELVPKSQFFAGGRRVEINRVQIDKGDVETWQFCDVCHYSKKVTIKAEEERCPNCGSAGFGNVAGQIHKMVRLRQVYANTNDRKSRIGDDQDERPPAFFNRKVLVTAQTGAMEAWAIDDKALGFGYEYIPGTQLREINFGESSELEELGIKTSIAGDDSQRTGFALCADCGMIQEKASRKSQKEKSHTFGCPSRRKNYTEKIEECLFLYREFEAEAVHILLPFAHRPGFETKLHSFVAAFQLGMKLFFKGTVDHIEATSLVDPAGDGSGAKLYLVLFDQIPGGTGYLKDLMKPDDSGASKIFKILKLANSLLSTCACRTDPLKDGCYRCVLAYRSRFELSETSRKVAEEILRELIKAESKLVPVDGLGGIRVSSLFDSPLESRFVEALDRLPGGSAKREIIAGEPGHLFKIQVSTDKSEVWEILTQRERKQRDGLAHGVSIDMLISSRRPEVSSTSEIHRPMAVFTDGFQYHVDRIGRDLFQRMALVQSGQTWTWSLSYHDVESQFRDAARDHYFDLIRPRRNKISTALFETVSHNYDRSFLIGEESLPSFDWLVGWLKEGPDQGVRHLQSLAVATVASMIDPMDKSRSYRGWRDEVLDLAPPALHELLAPENPDVEPKTALFTGPDEEKFVKIYATFDNRAFSNDDPGAIKSIKVLLWLDDRLEARALPSFQKTWNSVLRLFNLLQFLPNVFFITSTSADTLDFDALLASRPLVSELLEEDGLQWEMLRASVSELDAGYGVLVDRLFEANLPLPTEGLELKKDGRPISGPAELAWESKEIALIDTECMEETANDFRAAGWQVLDIIAVMEAPETLIQLFE